MTQGPASWPARLRAFARPLKYLAPAALLAGFLLLELYSRSAALLFNQAMREQDMLRGDIAVERLTAGLTGRVHFENLEWKDPDGRRILFIPDGSFQVKLWDVLRKRFSSTTIEALTLNRAALSIRLNDDMSWDFARLPGAPPPAPAPPHARKARESEAERVARGEAARRERRERIAAGWQNFDRGDKRIAMKLALSDCRVEVLFRDRQYLLEAVRLETDVDTRRSMKMKGATGPFGGTMIGNGIFLEGAVDFTHTPVPACDFSLIVDQVDPSSLGFGMDIHDMLSLHARFTGELTHITGRGALHMDELRIPALRFTDVDGNIYYEDALLRFTDVTAGVYGGALAAEGWYHLDSRRYQIDGHGQNLKTSLALPDQGLFCETELDIRVDSQGSAQTTSYSGRFVSGEGRYRWVPFRSLSGRFHDVGRSLDFYDVVIDFGGVQAQTDALHIKNGKLTLRPIRVTDAGGAPIATYDPDAKTLTRGEAAAGT